MSTVGVAGYRRTIAVLIAAALTVAFAVIVYSKSAVGGWSESLGSSLSLAAVTLVPYMVAAAVAAVTAIAVMNLLPWLKLTSSLQKIEARLKELAVGDLASRVRLSSDNQATQQLAAQLNDTVSELGTLMAKWKLLDRAQWDYLEHLRLAVARRDEEEMDRLIGLLQENLTKIGDLHQRLVT